MALFFKLCGLALGPLLLLGTLAEARELGVDGAWRVFQSDGDCWSTTRARGSGPETGGPVYLNASLLATGPEFEISLISARSFPTGHVIGLRADGRDIPLIPDGRQTAFPRDNATALTLLTASDRALYILDNTGYVIDMAGFEKALQRMRAACRSR